MSRISQPDADELNDEFESLYKKLRAYLLAMKLDNQQMIAIKMFLCDIVSCFATAILTIRRYEALIKDQEKNTITVHIDGRSVRDVLLKRLGDNLS